MLFVPLFVQAQKVTIKADVVRTLAEFWLKNVKITDIKTDSLLIGSTDQQLVTALAVKQYTDSTLASRRVSGVLPQIGYVLKWDGARWVPGPDLQGSGGGSGGAAYERRTVNFTPGQFFLKFQGQSQHPWMM